MLMRWPTQQLTTESFLNGIGGISMCDSVCACVWGGGGEWQKSHLHKHILILQNSRWGLNDCSQAPIRTVNCISASKAGTLILFAFI